MYLNIICANRLWRYPLPSEQEFAQKGEKVTPRLQREGSRIGLTRVEMVCSGQLGKETKQFKEEMGSPFQSRI
jgi:hypothetical protein